MSAVSQSLEMYRAGGARASWQVRATLGAAAMFATGTALAQGVPQSAALTNGLNTGGTSFLDGFTRTTPGWAVVTYLRQTSLDAVKDARGNDVPVFENPRIDSTLLLTQIAYVTPYTLFGGALGFNTLVPLVNLDASFGRDSIATLRDNGAGVGDLTFGPYLQMLPVMRDGRPVFSQRFEVDAVAPIGKFDRDRDLNQGAGYWSLVPNYAFTILPTAKWEVSARLNYVYNFRSERRPNLPDGFAFRNGQAGDAGWVNLATSWEVTPLLRLGVNAYYLTQFRDNRTNGQRVPDSRQRVFYAGPGGVWRFDANNILFANVYLPVEVRNAASGNNVNLQYVHVF
ncbi:SphA family protein [Xanthomonas floridensis]|uniref:Protein involved in meta-pathway of phenol degradation n=1 Tax=Xanthomonas floridensis TaxID=1843580 RepID=A0A1A9MFT5_9XANT|nr:transporter [Xanthomonas floridensis]MEA5123811.1 transporter [Xanthomonas floridensis]MEA5131490.1 transporter [Xanthomonas floridensis]OAG68901.1 protein involved in meta-pathway of phenol degradation [Xanthomonas floridensis]